MNEKQNSILEQAIAKYGVDNQLDMVIEECAELIQAINKFKRAGLITFDGSKILWSITKPHAEMGIKTISVYNSLCSEVADVKIMVAQMELMLSPEVIQISVDRKIERLEERLNIQKTFKIPDFQIPGSISMKKNFK